MAVVSVGRDWRGYPGTYNSRNGVFDSLRIHMFTQMKSQ